MRGNSLEAPNFAVSDDLGNENNQVMKPRKKKKKKNMAASGNAEEQRLAFDQDMLDSENQAGFHPEGGGNQ